MMTIHTATSDDFSTMDDDSLAADIHAATYRFLVLIAELDRREVWAAQGALSCAHWLSWACGIDTHTAREKVRVARALIDTHTAREKVRVARALRAAAALRGAGQGRTRLLQGPGAEANNGDVVVARFGDEVTLKRFVRLDKTGESINDGVREKADTDGNDD